MKKVVPDIEFFDFDKSYHQIQLEQIMANVFVKLIYGKTKLDLMKTEEELKK